VGARTGLFRRLLIQKATEEIIDLQKELVTVSRNVATFQGKEIVEVVRKRDAADRALADAIKTIPGAEVLLNSLGANQAIADFPEEWLGVSIQCYNKIVFRPIEGNNVGELPTYIGFIVCNGAVKEKFEIGPAGPINSAVETWRESIGMTASGRSNRSEINLAAKEVAKLVWEPIRERLGKFKKIVIAPDGILATIPFEALPDRTGIVIDNYLIVYVDSLSNLSLLKKMKYEGDRTLLVFGGIDYDSPPKCIGTEAIQQEKREIEPSHLNECVRVCVRSANDGSVGYLPNTEVEAKAIANLYQETFNAEPIVLTGCYASKMSLLKKYDEAEYLHIATHGYFCPEKVITTDDVASSSEAILHSILGKHVSGLAPTILCGLKMAGCNLTRKSLTDEGIITAEEIQNMNLTTCKLAVLSACETNVGLARIGQGILSLQRALKIAGAKGSIASLWKVNDQATLLLFVKFYENLWKNKMGPAESLRQAKLWLRNLRNEEVIEALRTLPGTTTRSIKIDDEGDDRINDASFYDNPYYWASFGYWGSVD